MMPINLLRSDYTVRRVLYSNPVIRQDYTYFNWTDVNGAGRLKQVTSGIMSDTDSPHKTGAGRLQDLRYTYDENGNVLTIKDYKADNTQTQSFTYDELDRLSSGRADNAAGIEMERDGGSIDSIDGTYAYETYTYNNSTGNLYTKAGVSYTYGDSNHKHAVTATGSDTYTYDANGNQIRRNVGGSSFTLSYDAENRLVSVSGAVTAAFVYDGDGNRVKGTVAGSTTTYLGNYFEWTGSTSTMNVRSRYYYAGSTKVAMRTGSSTLNFLLGDHLGSNAITTSSSGVKSSEIRYMPWGTTRYTSGSSPTTYQYTGQRLEVSLGLLFYNARWYDPAAGRFLQADTVIPGGVQGLDRYAYSYNNPVKYIDPSGHNPLCGPDGIYCDNSISWQEKFGITLSGDWSARDTIVIKHAVIAVGNAIALGGNMKINPAAAFTGIFGTVNITKGLANANEYCTNKMGSAGGCTSSPHQINFASLQQETVSGGGVISENIASIAARNNVVHELGHAFASLWYKKDGTYDYSGPYGQITDDYRNESGFAPLPSDIVPGSVLMWRQHPNDTSQQEIFADMFLGWTFNTWAANDFGRSDFMNINMATWIK